MGVEAMLESVDLVKAGKAPRIKQDEKRATYEGRCTAETARIDWGKSWRQIDPLIRGCNPAPGAWTTLDGKQLKIYKAHYEVGEATVAPGESQTDHATYLRFAGAKGLRRKGDRAHAQESEQPEHAVEQHRGHRHAAEQCGIAETSDRGGRDDTDQRRGQVRDHRGACDGEHLCRRDPGWSYRRMHA